ncbi:hypothetical protein HPB51_016569 [Rhipicephalus microplus]|uniref:Uncharacterized protein n=1 Tax=Rhipicephalus microplus TaxID=6941 RepID=A0A9J6EAV8_RHIMP|nr:hypothetical protein HPB51_016569 [Rhipicephalus microplus]
MVSSEGAGGRLGSKRRHYKGPKKHHEKHGSDSDNSPSSSPQQLKPTDTAGAQQATTSRASPSTSTQKTTSSLSPPPDNHKPAGDVAIAVKPAFAEHRLVVAPAPEPCHFCHVEDIPNATKTGILQYWSLAVATIVLGVVIVLLVLFGNPGPLRPHGHSAGEGCLTEQCRHYAKLLADAANLSVPVCDNFYAHVCGGWNAIQSGMGKRSVLEDFWLQLAKKEATRLGMINAPDHPEPIHMASRFIYTCLDVVKVPMVADVREVLERGNITWPKRNERPDFLGTLFYMARRVYIPVAFKSLSRSLTIVRRRHPRHVPYTSACRHVFYTTRER